MVDYKSQIKQYIEIEKRVLDSLNSEDILVVPLKNKLKIGDIVIGISGSGNSENVIRAFDYTNRLGADTIALTRYSGGKLKEIAEYNVDVNIDNMQIVEDVHLVLNHMMMLILSGMKGC